MSEEQKRRAAQAALDYIIDGEVVGVGSGSTVDLFIDALADRRHQIKGAVAASEASATRLRKHAIPVFDLNEIDVLDVYVDGADEADHHRRLIKGGGGALTREKIIAAVSRKFVCIAHAAKLVPMLGDYPLPIEVIPMARSFVARELAKLGGRPAWRTGFTTDNGQHILDVSGLDFVDPARLEQYLNNIPGIVTVGIFALRPADVLVIGNDAETKII